MTLVEHARRELTLTGEDPDVVDWFCRVVTEFASFGHSGGSAAATIPVLNELLRYRALTPLTDSPDEWVDRSEQSGYPLWQNVRDSRAMSENGGKTYWLVEDDADSGDGITPVYRSESRTEPKSFMETYDDPALMDTVLGDS
jgi:hypothetical protein